VRYRDGLKDRPAKVFVGICATARQWRPYDGDKPIDGAPPGFWWVD
jgi:hypothetical protein